MTLITLSVFGLSVIRVNVVVAVKTLSMLPKKLIDFNLRKTPPNNTKKEKRKMRTERKRKKEKK